MREGGREGEEYLVVERVDSHLVLEQYVHYNILTIVTSNVQWSATIQVDRVSLCKCECVSV